MLSVGVYLVQEYALIDNTTFSITCLPCPPGANCTGGLTAQEQLTALPGWWTPRSSDGLSYYRCRVETACIGGGLVSSSVSNSSELLRGRCAEGYDGTLCGVCAEGVWVCLCLCRCC